MKKMRLFLILTIFFIPITHFLSSKPQGMVWIEGGTFTMGSNSKDSKSDEKPSHLVKVDGFWMDEALVTNKEFREFVEETAYVTTAEKAQGSQVFKPSQGSLWEFTQGANWKHPLGPESSIDGKDDHPVVHISLYDAKAYATWKAKRLPTEAEWEYAALGGKKECSYPWGHEEFSEENPQANLWHGEFPHKSTKLIGTTPVKTFPPNSYGLYDMAGNTWQWCSDLYNAEFYAQVSENGLSCNPQGPSTSFDPDEPHFVKYVNRGGSFLCHESYCKGYRIQARMKNCPNSSANHLGFRCVMNQQSEK